MSRFQEQQCAFITREGTVTAMVWQAQPGASGVIAILITEAPVDNENLFAAVMRVFLKKTVRSPANQCNVFILILVKCHYL